MPLAIKDPREFSNIYPESNMILSQAIQDVTVADGVNNLEKLIVQGLINQQDQLLVVAYNLSPSYAVASYIWQSLQQVMDKYEINKQTKLFAIPVVIMVGSTQQVKLVSSLNQEKLQKLFIDKKLFSADSSNLISGNLFDYNGISRLKPSQIYGLMSKSNEEIASELFESSITAIVNLGEGVHLRYLLGYDKKASPINEQNYSQLGLELMKLLSDELTQPDVTIFPLPFPVCSLSNATLAGEFHRQEILISFTLSNLVKKLRLENAQPYLKISSQKGNIQIEVWESKAKEATEIVTWQLHPSDDFELICTILADLFNDMHLTIEYYPEHHHDH